MITDKDLKPEYEKTFKETYIKERRKVLKAKAEVDAIKLANRKPILETVKGWFTKKKK